MKETVQCVLSNHDGIKLEINNSWENPQRLGGLERHFSTTRGSKNKSEEKIENILN